MMKIYTIGFTKKPASKFFKLLKDNRIERIIDIRLRPGGQLSGFAKQEDLRYFLRELIGCDYLHIPELAPTNELLNRYRANKDWSEYEKGFYALLEQRGIPGSLDKSVFSEKVCCLLCSEATPEHCHRSLITNRLAESWDDVEVIHI